MYCITAAGISLAAIAWGEMGAGPPAFAMPQSLDRGRALVENRCLGCHADTTANAVALAPGARSPGLSEIAERYSGKPAEIADILLNRHPPMPRALLRDDEIEDIAGYLAALEGS